MIVCVVRSLCPIHARALRRCLRFTGVTEVYTTTTQIPGARERRLTSTCALASPFFVPALSVRMPRRPARQSPLHPLSAPRPLCPALSSDDRRPPPPPAASELLSSAHHRLPFALPALARSIVRRRRRRCRRRHRRHAKLLSPALTVFRHLRSAVRPRRVHLNCHCLPRLLS